MSLLDKLAKLVRPIAIPNITLYLVIGQVMFFGFSFVGNFNLKYIELYPILVLKGDIWRVVTFIFVPPSSNYPILLAFAWYLFYLMGSALEDHWGSARYCLFLLIGYLATVLAAFIFPYYPASNLFLSGSVFLAFAYINPTFELRLFFIIPVKIKWLALITWIIYLLNFVKGPWPIRFVILASVANFFFFFSSDILLRIKSGHRQKSAAKEKEKLATEPRHTCLSCGKTDLSHPDMDFRYCSTCKGACCYCEEHIRSHEHLNPEETPSATT
ncbi:MAG: rhomboid family intramembrane serine protease [Opitutaceae bacterium]|nr:rhomboid family intramembrane serine protease [Opitutaceae bacterium]